MDDNGSASLPHGGRIKENKLKAEIFFVFTSFFFGDFSQTVVYTRYKFSDKVFIKNLCFT